MNRQQLAVLTWFSELACVISTLVYCIIAISDIISEAPRLTSTSWYNEGFCVWEGFASQDSHTLSFGFDLIVGSTLAVQNWTRYREHNKVALLVAMVISVFCVFHGCAHLAFHFFGEYLAHASDLSMLSPFYHTVRFIGSFTFLSVAPFLGYVFGVSLLHCIIIHSVFTFFFIRVPQQFAFGAVQLVVNMWYCVPRLLWVGCKTNEAVRARLDDGWATASFGITAVMPTVFAEMLGCDMFLKNLFGHLVYDLAVLALAFAYSVSIWKECPNPKQPAHVRLQRFPRHLDILGAKTLDT
eukprot:TRINITY_DN31877_c0_g1_i1.p1 TRINITY_DN31877_c0_g1~~TRINITY_DN31877_c0_g1_i1.p1  ORF type:complete len:297 (+),score=16.15 TRINITY_DN31877_c0_g1_i1:61-951(+)